MDVTKMLTELRQEREQIEEAIMTLERLAPVAAAVEKIAGRDYTYFLLVAALAGRLEWFLYAAAAGAWAFVASLLAYFFCRREVRSTTV
jgi:hypothetical protein